MADLINGSGLGSFSAQRPVPGSVPPDLVDLCAVDNDLYCRTFFPRTFRKESPQFHKDIWDTIENPSNRYVALEVFRGGAKTTLLRTFTSKRIAYGTSRTILFVSASQGHSIRSVNWLRKQVDFNKKWADFYGLEKGSKWTDEVIEIHHRILGITITVVALGITGQTRGINIDDYRPDLIVVDDACDEENTATPEQKDKIEKLFFGSLANSLSPPTEGTDPKMALLQTGLTSDDLIAKCHQDPSWITHKFSILGADGKSTWPDLYPTDFVLNEKQNYINRNQLQIWMREKECTIIGAAQADFKPEWARRVDVLPQGMQVVLAIDPVPPPSEREIAQGLKRKDEEVVGAVGFYKGNYYLCDVRANKGHEPDWTIAAFFELADKWRPIRCRVEGVAYQRTLKWILQEAMKKRRRYIQINAVTDPRSKRNRILDALTTIAAEGRLFIHSSLQRFWEQWIAFPNPNVHDDWLDMLAMAVTELKECGATWDETEGGMQDEVEDLVGWRSAP